MPELTLPIRRRGALVKALVRPSAALLPGPQPAHGASSHAGPLSAYLDTGASDTMLDLAVVRALGLRPAHSAALNVLGRDDVCFHELYEVEVALVLAGEPPRWVPLVAVGGAVYQTGAVAALGRDFLRHVVFTYDGPRKQATLRW